MRSFSTSTTAIADDLLRHCTDVLVITRSDPGRAKRLDDLGKLVSDLETFIRRGYESIDDPLIDADDEILNWAFAETPVDLCSAIWLLSSGFYKSCASSLRNAFDISTASLYFQLRQNAELAGHGANRFFDEWDRGERQTPNWGEMTTIIVRQESIRRFAEERGVDIVPLLYEHFKHLCAYTHTSAYTTDGNPVTAINMGGVAPSFNETHFETAYGLILKSVSMIALLWQVTFPQMVKTEPLGPVSSGAYDALFPAPYGSMALAHI